MYGIYGGGLQLKFGLGLLRMSLSQSFKSSLGFKVLGGASPTTLNSSVYFKNTVFGSGDWISVFGIKSLPTLFGSAKTWSTFYGRNSLLLGPALMFDGGRRIYNSLTK